MDLLTAAPAFDGVPDEALRAMIAAGRPECIGPATALMTEGEMAFDLSIIESGSAVVVRGGEVVAVLGPGDVAGEMGALRGEPRRGTVVAAEELRVLTLTTWALRRLGLAHPVLIDALDRLARSRA